MLLRRVTDVHASTAVCACRPAACTVHRVQIKQLAGDLKLSREDVLDYLKWLATLGPKKRASLTEARKAAENAAAERKAIRQQQKAKASERAATQNKKYQGAEAALPTHFPVRASGVPRMRLRTQRFVGGISTAGCCAMRPCTVEVHIALPGRPCSTDCALSAEIKDLKREKRTSRISARQEATLRTVYDQGHKYPNQRLVQEICHLEKLTKSQVIGWFERQRKDSRPANNELSLDEFTGDE
jgi:hypothetical protein